MKAGFVKDWKGPQADSISFVVKSPPVSLQARTERKKLFYNAVKEAIGNPDYLLAGDVYVMVTWLMQERVRYETNLVADLDNTLKVLIDALIGPEGILVDDTQIQAIHY